MRVSRKSLISVILGSGVLALTSACSDSSGKSSLRGENGSVTADVAAQGAPPSGPPTLASLPTADPSQLPSTPSGPPSTSGPPPTLTVPSLPPLQASPVLPAPSPPNAEGVVSDSLFGDMLRQELAGDPAFDGLLHVRIASQRSRVEDRKVVTEYTTTVVEKLAQVHQMPYPTESAVVLRVLGGTATAGDGPYKGTPFRLTGAGLPEPIANGAEVVVFVRDRVDVDLGGNGPRTVVALLESDLMRVQGPEVYWAGAHQTLSQLRQQVATRPLVPSATPGQRN